MKWTLFAAASAVAVSALAAAAPKEPRLERSPDVLQAEQLRKAAATAAPSYLRAWDSTAALASLTDADVGDADSFGRHVTYLGMAQTSSVVVQADCSASDPAVERCIVAAVPPAATAFDEPDLARIHLPARATRSLLCFTLTPFISVQWANSLATPAMARFHGSAVVTIDNDVLADPSLVDPSTGLPFGGSVTLALSTYSDMHTLQPGEVDSKNLFMTRACIAGVMSKRSLVDNFGLSEAQATEFFRKPMTVRFGSRGTVALVELASYFYGIRLYGD